MLFTLNLVFVRLILEILHWRPVEHDLYPMGVFENRKYELNFVFFRFNFFLGWNRHSLLRILEINLELLRHQFYTGFRWLYFWFETGVYYYRPCDRKEIEGSLGLSIQLASRFYAPGIDREKGLIKETLFLKNTWLGGDYLGDDFHDLLDDDTWEKEIWQKMHPPEPWDGDFYKP